MTEDPNKTLEQLRAKLAKGPQAAPKAAPRAPDRQDMAEATAAPDARKARDLVRKLRTDSLPLLARELPKFIGDSATRQRIEAALDRFMQANAVYHREELKDENTLIGWMGPPHGDMPVVPPVFPEHKVELAAAWNALLRSVNECAKVGLIKRDRYSPITLQVDPDLS